MATFTKRGESWFAQVRRKGISRSASFPTKTQAVAWATHIEAELIAGKHSTIANKSLAQLFERYRDEVSPTKRSGDKEMIRLNRLIADPISSTMLTDLRDTHFISLRDRLLEGTSDRPAISGASVLRYFNIINPALKKAVNEWKWLDTNPLEKVQRPANSKPRERRPSLDEINRLIYVMNYTPDCTITTVMQEVAAAMLFAIETGCRAKELCTMRRSTVNLEQRTARVEEDTKTGSRDIALTTEACRIIKQCIKSFDADTVFRITPALLDANFRKYKDKAGISGLTFHDMKHEACTRLAKFMPIEDLARQLGTRNLKILMIYYNPTAAEIAALLP